MNKQNQIIEKKRKLIHQQNDNEHDEQVEKALKFFDSILDEYLNDENTKDDDTIEKPYGHIRFTTGGIVQENKHSHYVGE